MPRRCWRSPNSTASIQSRDANVLLGMALATELGRRGGGHRAPAAAASTPTVPPASASSSASIGRARRGLPAARPPRRERWRRSTRRSRPLPAVGAFWNAELHRLRGELHAARGDRPRPRLLPHGARNWRTARRRLAGAARRDQPGPPRRSAGQERRARALRVPGSITDVARGSTSPSAEALLATLG